LYVRMSQKKGRGKIKDIKQYGKETDEKWHEHPG